MTLLQRLAEVWTALRITWHTAGEAVHTQLARECRERADAE